MQSLENNPLHLSRAGIVMLTWGVLILLGGAITQWYFPSVGEVLAWWGVISVAGIAVQLLCQVRDQPFNCGIWIVAVAIGWAFTLYATSPEVGWYGDIAGVWLIFLGVGYINTARRINSRFMIFAVLHFVVGGLMELSVHKILPISFLDNYASLILGLVGGLSLVIAAFFARVEPQVGRLESSKVA